MFLSGAHATERAAQKAMISPHRFQAKKTGEPSGPPVSPVILASPYIGFGVPDEGCSASISLCVRRALSTCAS